eukprot:6491752-Amphidinium_carterae.3
MLVPGARAAVWYAGDEVYHERMICWPVGELDYIILTPDMDCYLEHFGPPDITRWHAFPSRAARALERGRREASNECLARGIPVPQFNVGVAPDGVVRELPANLRENGGIVAGGGPVVLAIASRWVFLECRHGQKRGDEVTLNGREHMEGDVAIHTLPPGERICIRKLTEGLSEFMAGESSHDARTLPVRMEGEARVRKVFRDAVKEMRKDGFTDWAVPGPRAIEWCLNFINRRGGGPLDHHRYWRTTLGLRPLSKESWGVTEHELVMKMLDNAVSFDSLDITNLASFETALRKAQLVEYAYCMEGGGDKDKGKGKNKGGMHLGIVDEYSVFLGTHREAGEMMCAPELLEYVAREVEKDANVLS